MFNTNTSFLVVLGDGSPRHQASIYRVVARRGVDVIYALEAAAADYLKTEEGREYNEMICANRPFGWGDVPVISPDVLVQHNIYLIEAVSDDVSAVIVLEETMEE